MKTPRLSFFLLLISLMSQSCQNMIPEGSIDYVKQGLKGPSFKGDLPNNDDLSFNIVVLYFYGINGSLPTAGQPYKGPASQTLLASTRNQLSFVSAYTPPKPTSFLQNGHFALMPGIEIVRKGSKTSDSFGKDVTHLLYLEVPIYALYRHYLPDNKGELFGGLGPYFAYGLTGTFKSDYNGQTVKSDAFDTKNGGFNRFDAGLALTAGYQFPSSLRIRLAYDLGLVNIQPSPFGSDGDKTFNRALSLNVGYPLDKLVDKFKKK